MEINVQVDSHKEISNSNCKHRAGESHQVALGLCPRGIGQRGRRTLRSGARNCAAETSWHSQGEGGMATAHLSVWLRERQVAHDRGPYQLSGFGPHPCKKGVTAACCRPCSPDRKRPERPKGPAAAPVRKSGLDRAGGGRQTALCSPVGVTRGS